MLLQYWLLSYLAPVLSSVVQPALHGPGYDCQQAFPGDSLTLQTVLLCNKTVSTLYYNKTEVQLLDTRVLRLGEGECEQFQGQGFRCVEHYQCHGDSTLITDGSTSTRLVSVVTTVNVSSFHSYTYSILDTTDRKCQTYTKVCCGPGNKDIADIVNLKNVPVPEQDTCESGDESTILRCNSPPPEMEDIKTEVPRPEPPPDYVPKCGRHHSAGYRQSLINLDVKLHESQFAEWPNMCALLVKGVYNSGASLISPRWVITAAHTLPQPWEGVVRCGDWDTAGDTELYSHQERVVTRVVYHPGYDTVKGARGNLWHDLALLQTDQPFTLAPHVDTVCLPPPRQDFTGQLCAATGWGQDRFGDRGKPQVILKEVWMNILEHNSCQEKLRKTKLGSFFILDQSFTCAGGQTDKDMCTGDGGSPLMCEGPNGFVQAGIVSWGINCGLNDVPGVYVNLSNYVCWIKNTVEEIEGSDYFPYNDECNAMGTDYDYDPREAR